MRLARASNPSKTLATITFRGRTKKELARNANALIKRYHLPTVKRGKARSGNGEAKPISHGTRPGSPARVASEDAYHQDGA
jgi:hypothetical protein